jgi:GT2 family glycosyltransferase
LLRVRHALSDFIATQRTLIGRRLDHSILYHYYRQFLRGRTQRARYREWVARERAATPSLEWHRREAAKWRRRPRVSVLIPVHNPNRAWLEAAICSVRDQCYENWQLCLCDDASSNSWVIDYLTQLAGADDRIRVARSDSPLGISGALNRAGQMADGEYVGFLDHDDLLSPFALHYIVEELQDQNVELVYSDEDIIDERAVRNQPNFKPDWSPDLLDCCMYINHFMVVQRSRLVAVGWFRSACDGAQDYDLALRLTERNSPVRHVSRVLYHWRRHPGSSLGSASAKPYTHKAGKLALQEAVARRRQAAVVEDGPQANTYDVRRAIAGSPLVSIVICSRDPRILRRCLLSINRKTGYPRREIVIVQHKTSEDPAMEMVIDQFQCHRVVYAEPFDFSHMNNLGAAATRGEYLIFLNDDIQALDARWLECLLAPLQVPEVGVVGAKLLFRSGAFQHAGMIVGGVDGCAHPGRGSFGSLSWNWFDLTRDVSAVTGACLSIRKALFMKLEGFDRSFPVNYGDVDLCLRVRSAGFRIIYQPRAVLQHDEAASRSPRIHSEERELFFARWGDTIAGGDPFYNRNLTSDERAVPDLCSPELLDVLAPPDSTDAPKSRQRFNKLDTIVARSSGNVTKASTRTASDEADEEPPQSQH